MARQIVGFEIGRDVVRRPVDQRIDFEPALRIRGIDLEARQIGPGGRLESLATGEARIESRKRFFERLDLA